MTLAKVKQDRMMLAKVKEQDGMMLAEVKEQDGMMLAKVKEQDGMINCTTEKENHSPEKKKPCLSLCRDSECKESEAKCGKQAYRRFVCV